MSRRAIGYVTWCSGTLSIVLALGGLFFTALNHPRLSGLVSDFPVSALNALAFSVMGALIASRQPRNRIGWLMCAEGLSEGIFIFASQYGRYALFTRPGSLPAGVWLAWLGNWTWAPGLGILLMLLPLLFPDGEPPSPRWRAVAWMSAGWLATVVAVFAVTPGPLYNVPSIRNPVGIAGAEDVLAVMLNAQMVFTAVPILAAIASVIVRFRRAVGQEHEQLKWFTYAAALLVVVTFVTVSPLSASFPAGVEPLFLALQLVAFPAVPIAIGIAVLRYRLYDIDLLVNRTLVYGTLTVALLLTYWGSVVALQRLLQIVTGQISDVAIVVTTLGIAALFQPLRRWIQAFIDRGFYRRKYDAAAVLAAFSATARDEVDLASLSARLIQVAEDTMQPAHVALWLRPFEGKPRSRES